LGNFIFIAYTAPNFPILILSSTVFQSFLGNLHAYNFVSESVLAWFLFCKIFNGVFLQDFSDKRGHIFP
jgi:hypothetical protein